MEAFAFASSAGLGAGRRRKIVARTSKLLCLCGSPGAIHRRKSSSVSRELLPAAESTGAASAVFIYFNSEPRSWAICVLFLIARAPAVCVRAGFKKELALLATRKREEIICAARAARSLSLSFPVCVYINMRCSVCDLLKTWPTAPVYV